VAVDADDDVDEDTRIAVTAIRVWNGVIADWGRRIECGRLCVRTRRKQSEHEHQAKNATQLSRREEHT
jgi:hypothetical protein